MLFATGNKVEYENDLILPGEFGLRVDRTWNQYSNATGIFGTKFNSTFDQRIVAEAGATNGAMSALRMWLKDGDNMLFQYEASTGRWNLSGVAGSSDYIVKDANGRYVYMLPDGSSKTFASGGSLLQLRSPQGLTWTLEYTDPNFVVGQTRPNTSLTRVVHSNGRTLTFQFVLQYGVRVVSRITDPAGNVYQYGYSPSGLFPNGAWAYLTQVTYPAASRDFVGPSKAHVITYDINTKSLGMEYYGKLIDGVRYSTFAYTNGKATLSEHAGGAQRYTFAYLPDGRTAITNPLGQVTTYTFDAAGNVIGTSGAPSTYCPASATSTVYDAANHTTLRTDADGLAVRTRTDDAGNEIERIQGFGGPTPVMTSYEWQQVPRLLKRITTAYQRVDYSYTPTNRVQSITTTDLTPQGVGKSSTVGYTYEDADGNGVPERMTVTGPWPGAYVTTLYNAQGDVAQVQRPSGTVSYGGFDANGRATQITDVNGVTTSMTLDGRGQVLTVSKAGVPTVFAYNAQGDLAQVQAADGTITTITVDTAFRYQGETRADTFRRAITGADDVVDRRSLALDADGNVTATVVARDTYTIVDVDPKPVCKRFPCNIALMAAPGLAGMLDSTRENSAVGGGDSVAVTQATGSRRDTQIGLARYTDFDEASLPRAERGNAGQRWSYARSAGGRLNTVTDATGVVVATQGYDTNGRVASNKDALGAVTQYGYRGDALLTRVTDPRSAATLYEYDGAGNLTLLSSPDTNTTTFLVNGAGQRTSESRADGTQISYGYTTDGRIASLTATRSGASLTRTYSYDNCTYGRGRLCAVTESSGESVAYSYTALGALQTQTDTIAGQSFVTRWDYAASTGLLQSLTYPNGVVLRYGWQDGLPRSVTLTKGATTVAVVGQALYRPFGPVESFTDSLGATRSFSYDTDGRLTASSGNAGALGFGYDTRNLLTGMTGADISSASYDNAGRLTDVSQTDLSGNFGFDANGNRRYTNYWAAGVGGSATYNMGSGNRLANITSPSGTRAFDYDAAGNLTRDQRSGVTDCHRYDAFARLAQFERYSGAQDCGGPSGGPASLGQYRFNGLNQRSFKNAGGVSTRFVYGPSGELLYEVPSSGNAKAYVWFSGQIVAMEVGGAVHSVYSDHLGRPRKVLAADTGTRWDAINRAYDRAIRVDALGGFNIGLPGQYFDAESGLWQNWYRTYDASIGRYTQSDPIGLAGGINTYAYVGGNPLTRIDWAGLTQCDIDAAVNTVKTNLPGLAFPANGPQPNLPIDGGVDGTYQGGTVDMMRLNERFLAVLSGFRQNSLLNTVIHETLHANPGPGNTDPQIDRHDWINPEAARLAGLLSDKFQQERKKCGCGT